MLQTTFTSVSTLTTFFIEIAEAIEGARSTPVHVAEGAVVKAVYLEIWIQSSSSGDPGSVTGIFFKNPGGSNVPSGTDMQLLHDWDNKKNIFNFRQGLSPPVDSAMFPIFLGWYKIPKGKQRMGLGDKITVAIRNNGGVDMHVCGGVVYKEQT